ncbi:Transcription initiation factor TFIID subunit 9 [Smittium culicis]|uniref:Transcription initiation factor TFIID subunit 9 n=1 Tax=Smittium culicis TaxID=133412 RepID=A0A1R1X313_9FUNG|nr:Transcription initiation factor TFIID subunit 9 [Smittium culicis]
MDPIDGDTSEENMIPKEIKLMTLLLQSQGVEDCEPNVINQLLEFSNMYSEHADKKELDLDDVRLAIQGRVNYSFTNPPEREFFMELAETCNKVPLPLIPERYGVRLPPEKHSLVGINFQIVPEGFLSFFLPYSNLFMNGLYHNFSFFFLPFFLSGLSLN